MLKFNKSLYIINQAVVNWFDLLNNGLERRGYHKYQVDPVYFTENTDLF